MYVCMYICIYIYVYICIYICICVCMYIYIYAFVYIDIHTWVIIYIYTHTDLSYFRPCSNGREWDLSRGLQACGRPQVALRHRGDRGGRDEGRHGDGEGLEGPRQVVATAVRWNTRVDAGGWDKPWLRTGGLRPRGFGRMGTCSFSGYAMIICDSYMSANNCLSSFLDYTAYIHL